MLIDDRPGGSAAGRTSAASGRRHEEAICRFGVPQNVANVTIETVAETLAQQIEERSTQSCMRYHAESGRPLRERERALLVELRERIEALPADRIDLDHVYGLRLADGRVVSSHTADVDDCNTVGCLLGWAMLFFPKRKRTIDNIMACVSPLLFSSGAAGRVGKMHALQRLDIVLGDEAQREICCEPTRRQRELYDGDPC